MTRITSFLLSAGIALAAFAAVGVPLASAHGYYSGGYYGSGYQDSGGYGSYYNQQSYGCTNSYCEGPGYRTYPQLSTNNSNSYSTNGRIQYTSDGVAYYSTGSGNSYDNTPGVRCYQQEQQNNSSGYNSSGRIQYTSSGVAYFSNESAPSNGNYYYSNNGCN